MQMQKRVYLIGAVILLTTAIFSKGYHHFDEHFQILEFASLKLGLTHEEDMPWEYFFSMRSAIQPAIVVCAYRIINWFTLPDPFLLTTLLRIISALLSLATILLFIETFQRQITSQKLKQAFLWLSFFLWFTIYSNVRFSSENWSGNIFMIGLCLSVGNFKRKSVHFLFIGFVLGLAFLFRYQTGFLIAGLVLWLLCIQKDKILHLVSLLVAIGLVTAGGILIDRWFYDEWTFSIWNYFDQNILQNKAAGFGVEPWWYYLKEVILNTIPPFSILYVSTTFTFFLLYPKHIITFCIAPFLLVHFIIGHKEVRFLFPLVNYLPFIVIMALQVINNYQISKLRLRTFQVFAWAFTIVNLILLLVVMFRPADGLISLYQKLYYNYKSPTILYYTDANPYLRILNIHFYKQPDLEVTRISSVTDIKRKNYYKILFSTDHPEQLIGNENNWRLVYSTLPEWIKKFNFNHWQDRTRFWYVYELKD